MTIRKDLLADLADHLDKVPKFRFRIEGWRFRPQRHTCKTAGCAIGHAPNVPTIKALGFTCNITPYLPPQGEYDRARSGWDAVSALFGISVVQAENLFSMYAYADRAKTSKDKVSARIRDFIKRPKFYGRSLVKF